MQEGEADVVHDGYTYQPIDIEATGFAWDGQGGFPQPKIRIANIGNVISSAIIGFGDIVGSKFIRVRTFARHLDNGSHPDPTAIFPYEIFTVDQRTSQNKMFVEWRLKSSLEHGGIKLPRRQVVRDTCTHTYRIYNGVDFDYQDATCPYIGGRFYDEEGNVTTIDKDVCGRKLSDCKARDPYGNGVLPSRAFPGVSRNRVS
jgi:lambda family phage minor tail protein L